MGNHSVDKCCIDQYVSRMLFIYINTFISDSFSYGKKIRFCHYRLVTWLKRDKNNKEIIGYRDNIKHSYTD
jgi:hypothetical protein